MAERISMCGNEKKELNGKRSKFTNSIIIFAGVLMAGVIFKEMFFMNIIVPTSSMYPEITEGDRILATRVLKDQKLKRGDVLLFERGEKGTKYIKRLIGLPGDVVFIRKDGRIIVNGKEIDEEYVENQMIKGETYFGINYGEHIVPEGEYFFLGDNRRFSKDSRYWENPFVKRADLLAKAQITYYPFDNIKIFKEQQY